MKQKLLALLSFFCLSQFGTFAQYSPYYFNNYTRYIYHYEDWSINARKTDKAKVYANRVENKIVGSKSININHKGDTTSNIVMKFNKKGRMVSVSSETKKGDIINIQQRYLDDTLITLQTRKHKNKANSAAYRYDKNRNLIRIEEKENDKLERVIENEYQNGLLVKQTYTDYHKRKPRLYKVLNTYNDEKKLIKTEYYKNDKLERIWKYDCSERGLAEKPKKSAEGVPSSSSCSWREESSDGSYTTYYRRLNDKSVYLTEQHFTKDSVVVYSKTFNEKDRLTYETYIYDNIKVYKWYKRNGKLRRISKSTSDSDLGELVSSNVYFGLVSKYVSNTERRYNGGGLLVELINNYNGRQRKRIITYEIMD